MNRIVVKGDLESLRFFYYAGVKDLATFVNVDKRSLAHIVKKSLQREQMM